MKVLEILTACGAVPLIAIDDAAFAAPLAKTLVEAGITAAQVTLRDPGNMASIEAMSNVEGLTIGVGRVMTAAQVRYCADAGARFVQSLGFDDAMLDQARARELLYLPGVSTATEIQRAQRASVQAVNFIAAEAGGAASVLRALHDNFPEMGFLASGGVTPYNVGTYLRCPGVLAVNVSWTVPRELVSAGDYSRISRLALGTCTLVSRSRSLSEAHP